MPFVGKCGKFPPVKKQDKSTPLVVNLEKIIKAGEDAKVAGLSGRAMSLGVNPKEKSGARVKSIRQGRAVAHNFVIGLAGYLGLKLEALTIDFLTDAEIDRVVSHVKQRTESQQQGALRDGSIEMFDGEISRLSSRLRNEDPATKAAMLRGCWQIIETIAGLKPKATPTHPRSKTRT